MSEVQTSARRVDVSPIRCAVCHENVARLDGSVVQPCVECSKLGWRLIKRRRFRGRHRA